MSAHGPPPYDSEASAPLMPPQASYAQPGQEPMYPYAPAGQAQYQPDANEKQQHMYATPMPAPTPMVAYQPTVLQPGQPIPPGANVVFVQAPVQAPDSRLHKMKDLLGLSIFTTICCNLIFGIIAIVYSLRVREAKRRNDFHEAKSAYRVMLAMNITGIVLSVVLEGIIVILYVSGVVVASSMNSYYG